MNFGKKRKLIDLMNFFFRMVLIPFIYISRFSNRQILRMFAKVYVAIQNSMFFK